MSALFCGLTIGRMKGMSSQSDLDELARILGFALNLRAWSADGHPFGCRRRLQVRQAAHPEGIDEAEQARDDRHQ